MIEAVDLTKRYGSRLAVDSISLEVHRGEIFGFLGPNGAGKTTTIGMLLGVIRPTSGVVRLLDGKTENLHKARRGIGSTVERPNLYPHLSGLENLKVVASIKGVPASRIQDALHLTGIWERRRDICRTYSLGMKQRLALAAAVLGDPELVILDEPMNGLDPAGVRDIREIVLELAASGKTVFLSSHLLSEVDRVCDRVAVLKAGRIIYTGPVAEMTASGCEVEVGGSDLTETLRVARSYPNASSVRQDGSLIVMNLTEADLGRLTEFFAVRGIYVTHLCKRGRSLETAFLDLTESPDDS